MRVMSFFRYLFLSLIFLLCQYGHTQNNERLYDIEVIVFKHLVDHSPEENWNKNIIFELPKGQLAVFEENNQISILNNRQEPSEKNEPIEKSKSLDERITLLDKTQYPLSDVFKTLRLSRNYRPLIHHTWRQPIGNKNDALWIRLTGGDDFSENFHLDGKAKKDTDKPHLQDYPNVDNNTIKKLDTHSSESEAMTSEMEPMVPEIDGAIQLYIDRFLYVKTQLFLRKPGKIEMDINSYNASVSSQLFDETYEGIRQKNTEQTESDDSDWHYDLDNYSFEESNELIFLDQLIHYPMQQYRRIKRKDIHFFDHPLYGLLIRVTRFDETKNKTPDVEPSEETLSAQALLPKVPPISEPQKNNKKKNDNTDNQ